MGLFTPGKSSFTPRSPFATTTPAQGQAGAATVQRAPIRVRTGARHMVKLQAARDAAQSLPQGEGESVHWLLLGFFDPVHLITAILEQYGHCKSLRLATLSLSKRNVDLFCGMLDNGMVDRISVLTSTFQFRMDADIYDHLHSELTARGQRVGAAVNHNKLALFDLADGRKFVMEGSANLRSCRSIEQVALHGSVALHDWYAEWFDDTLTRFLSLREEEKEQLPDGAPNNADEED